MKKYWFLVFGILVAACQAEAVLAHQEDGIYNPRDYGAVCDVESGTKEASYDPETKELTITYPNGSTRQGTHADIGKIVGYAGHETTVEAISEDGNIITTDKLNVNNTIWYLGSLGADGTDDADNVNALIKMIGYNGRTGGTIDFKGMRCFGKMTQEQKDAGQPGVLVIDKMVGTPLSITSSSNAQQHGGFVWRWGSESVVHFIAKPDGQAMDNFSLTNTLIDGMGFAKTAGDKREDCIHPVSYTHLTLPTTSRV